LEIEVGIEALTFIGAARVWTWRGGSARKEWTKVFAQRVTRSAPAAVADLPGVAERRIVAQVAIELRISPRFSDDGVPEGTCDRPLSIHLDEEEGEQEIDVTEEFARAFRDEGVR
jgi:hypothetical protein